MTSSHWILVANASHAHLWELRPELPLARIGRYEHPASRLHGRDLGASKPGRTLRDGGYGALPFEPKFGPQRKEQLRFAQELADVLEAGARSGACTAVTLVASSPFLGELNQMLGSASQRMLCGVHDLDLTHLGVAELSVRLRDLLAEDANAGN